MSNGSRIAILSPDLADQIAAGEVVERAASVVKELCENAIDAAARRIDVDIEGGGRRLIRVVDDGAGMTPEEARLSLKRHATSKITKAEDLWGLKSFGFRGEALPSIAAISRMSLHTKVRGAPGGFRLEVSVGAEVDDGEIGIPDGTQVEVRDLFFNTPARLKFQKTDATEAANVNEAVLRLALSHPEIHFRLRLSGRLALDLPPHRDLAERVRAALVRRGLGTLHEVRGEEAGHRVHAFLAAPSQAVSSARSTFLFVGRRFVRDRALLHALAHGYGELLDRGRYPVAVLFLEVPGAELDVNVHPQKLEVRFSRAAEVHAAVRHVVGQGLAHAPWAGVSTGSPRAHSLPPEAEAVREWGRSALAERRGADPLEGRASGRWPAAGGEDGPFAGAPTFEPVELPDRMRYIGDVDGAFWICEAGPALVLLDPHTVHERILVRRLEAARVAGSIPARKLLFPVPVALERVLALDPPTNAILSQLGFEVEAPVAGPSNMLVLHALPGPLADGDPKPLLLSALEVIEPASRGREVADGEGGRARVSSAELTARVLSALACTGSVRAGECPPRARALELLMDARLAFDAGPPSRATGSSLLPAADFVCRRGRRLGWVLPLADLHAHFGPT